MRRSYCIALAVVACMAAAVIAQAKVGSVAAKDISSLVLGPKDIAWDVNLWSFEKDTRHVRVYTGAKNALSTVSAGYTGPQIAGPSKGASHSIGLTIAVYNTPVAAGEAAQAWISSFSVITPEVRDKRSVPFADRAWDSGDIITYSRRNVLVRIHASSPQIARDAAVRVTRKIDAAAAGKPGVAPLSAGIYKGFLVPARNTIHIKCIHKPAVAAEVDSVTNNDCLVRLEALAYAVSGKYTVKVADSQAKAWFGGRTFTFTDGSKVVRVEGKTIELSRPAVVSGANHVYSRNVMVPMSFVEKVLGRHVRWEKGKNVRIAVI